MSGPDAWSAHVGRQLEELGAPDCAAELNSGAQALHELLSHSAPPNTFASHGLTDGGQDWLIERVPRTLSELTGEERNA